MRFLYIIIICLAALAGCKKQSDWLDEKRQLSDIVPSTLSDFQSILDNTTMYSVFPLIGNVGIDNYYLPDEIIFTGTEKNAYLWSKEIFEGLNPGQPEYSNPYIVISNANIVLDKLPDVEVSDNNRVQYNNVKGQALFFRAIMFSELASLYCKPYDKATAATDLGIPVRTTSNVNHIEPRSSVERAYQQMRDDLSASVELLPVAQTYKTRPSRIAAFALLARVSLMMAEYTDAKRYADSALKYNENLLDFNDGSVSLTKPNRFPDYYTGNVEVLFYASGYTYATILPDLQNYGIVDTTLYASYSQDDLRRAYFYSQISAGKAKFVGNYTGMNRNFAGLATNEVYFIRAESNARLNNVPDALSDLNKILRKRFKTGFYTDFNTSDAVVALEKILEERRKELPFTGQIRWQDLRRLNKDPRFAKTLVRKYQTKTYELLPNDRRYLLPFPIDEINKAGIQQNER